MTILINKIKEFFNIRTPAAPVQETLLQKAQRSRRQDYLSRYEENRRKFLGYDCSFGSNSIKLHLENGNSVLKDFLLPNLREEVEKYYKEEGFIVEYEERPGKMYDYISILIP